MKELEMWLKCGTETLQLPIVPPSFEVTVDGGHTAVTISSFGETVMLGKRNCRGIEISSFFPAREYSFAAYRKDREPYDYVNKINTWFMKVVHFTIVGSNINKDFVITSWKYSEPDGTGDISFTLALKEYRVPTFTEPLKVIAIQRETTTLQVTATKRTAKEVPKTYVVKQGDNLWDIAKKQTGSSSNYMAIYNKNKSVIEAAAKKHGYTSSTHNNTPGWWIFPGTKLVIK